MLALLELEAAGFGADWSLAMWEHIGDQEQGYQAVMQDDVTGERRRVGSS